MLLIGGGGISVGEDGVVNENDTGQRILDA